MNELTEKLIKPHPAAALQIAHEQACHQLIGIKDIANNLITDSVDLPTIAKLLQQATNDLGSCYENIYKLSLLDKERSIEKIEELAINWMTLAKNAVDALKDIQLKI